MAKSDSVLLSGGQVATLEPDRWNTARIELVVDGTPQSSVNLSDPSDLAFEYVERIGHVIDLIGDPREPITAVHFGAGALTIPRYVEWTRPGSRQQVVELEPELVDLVRERLPLPEAAPRSASGTATRGRWRSSCPAACGAPPTSSSSTCSPERRSRRPVTTVEFYRLAARLLNERGVLVVNVADGAGLPFARGQMATIASVLPHVAVVAEAQTMKGRRFGNLVIVGTRDAAVLGWLPRLVAAGPHPAQAVSGEDLQKVVRNAPVVTDATASPSPDPGRGIFSR